MRTIGTAVIIVVALWLVGIINFPTRAPAPGNPPVIGQPANPPVAAPAPAPAPAQPPAANPAQPAPVQQSVVVDPVTGRITAQNTAAGYVGTFTAPYTGTFILNAVNAALMDGDQKIGGGTNGQRIQLVGGKTYTVKGGAFNGGIEILPAS